MDEFSKKHSDSYPENLQIRVNILKISILVKMISEEVNPFGIPKLFIFGTVASGLVFGVVVGLTLIICKHKKVYLS